MDEMPADRCGYTFPEDNEIGYSAEHQNCCYREVLPDADHCAWHTDPEDTDEKTVETLRNARVGAEVREVTSPAGELVDGAILRGLDLGDKLSLDRVAFRGADLTDTNLAEADLTDTNLAEADLTDTDLSGADLTGAVLFGADLTGAVLLGADLTNTNLVEANLTDAALGGADLTDTDLGGADLTDAYLAEADLSGAHLAEADLTDTNLDGADLTNTYLERATLIRTNLFDTTLTGVRLHGATLTDVQLNAGATICSEEVRSAVATGLQRLNPPPFCGYDIERRQADDLNADDRRELLSKAADSYQEFEKLARENAQPALQTSMFVLRQDIQRARYWERGEYLEHAFARVSRSVFKYGESLFRIFLCALLIIAGYAAVYARFDLIRSSSGEFLHGTVNTLYFSTLTFTTLGLGDFQPDPSSELARALVTSQAAIGAILIAIFVFVLGRRAAR